MCLFSFPFSVVQVLHFEVQEHFWTTPVVRKKDGTQYDGERGQAQIQSSHKAVYNDRLSVIAGEEHSAVRAWRTLTE